MSFQQLVSEYYHFTQFGTADDVLSQGETIDDLWYEGYQFLNGKKTQTEYDYHLVVLRNFLHNGVQPIKQFKRHISRHSKDPDEATRIIVSVDAITP